MTIDIRKQTSELCFEDAVVQHLVNVNGFTLRSDSNYDKNTALDQQLLINFIKDSQPDIWSRYQSMFGTKAEEAFLREVVAVRDRDGLVELIQRGFHSPSIQRDVQVMFNKPENGHNPELIRGYERNEFSVARQIHYAADKNSSVDVVLFINGIPFTVVELKSELKGQNVDDAIEQFKQTRDARDLLFKPNVGSLMFFAVSQSSAMMAGQLEGSKTYFLPFNVESPGAVKTEFLWRDFWTRDSLIDVLSNFIFLLIKDDKKKVCLPRYHQWDCVVKVEKDVLAEGAGERYLIQHSAGSGKTLTITWLASRLASLHNNSGNSIFDKVIVVTDRKIVDRQLQESLNDFIKTQGMARFISGNSRELGEALESNCRIVVSTIQKFSYIQEILKELNKKGDKKFALIIDEAHSSQGGKYSGNVVDGIANNSQIVDEESDELEQLAASPVVEKAGNVSFFAFTATPRDKTLQLFGRLENDKFVPFHLYGMKQAINEGFILNVLRCDTYKKFEVNAHVSYLGSEGEVVLSPVSTREGVKRIGLSPEVLRPIVREKSRKIVDDFVGLLPKMMNGSGKGMIVADSRIAAAMYLEEIRQLIADNSDCFGVVKPLVAYSGELANYERLDGTVATMTEAGWNGFSESQFPDKFDSDEYNLLIVANKYQTGFDQPKLCVMFVDKSLQGVNAVQTLSRLNRIAPGKTKVYVRDFVNSFESLAQSFAPYYDVTEGSTKVEYSNVVDLARQALNFGVYNRETVEAFTRAARQGRELSPLEFQGKLLNVLAPAIETINKMEISILRSFRGVIYRFLKTYELVEHRMFINEPFIRQSRLFLQYLKHHVNFITERGEFDWVEDVKLDFVNISKVVRADQG